MTKSSSTSSGTSGAGHILSSRYATSLIDVANQSGELASVEKDIVSLHASLESSKDLQAMLNSPVYSKEQQLSVVQAISAAAGYHQLTANFLSVLAMNGRLNSLPSVISAFAAEIERRNGIVEAKIVSAFPLNESQQKNLVDTLSAKTGKAVKLALYLDKTLLGGMVVTIGSRMIDDSLKTRLSQLKQAMVGKKAA